MRNALKILLEFQISVRVLCRSLILTLFSIASLFAENVDPFFDEGDRPSAKLLQLLALVGIDLSNPSLQEINDWTQKNLLRQGERWQEQTTRYEELKPNLKPLLCDLGFLEGTTPCFKKYQGAIVHGALLTTVQLRLDYLIKQWDQGIRFTILYFLSGERPLDPEKEMINALNTEKEMIQWVWEQAEIPDSMRKEITVYFINAPMKKNSDTEAWLRPTTEDTVKEWLQTNPAQGCYLAISNAPYIQRQDLVMQTLAPLKYQFDTVGPSANDHVKMAVFLDELARYLFQLKNTNSNKN